MDDPSQEYKRSVGVTLMQKPSRTMQFNFFGLFLGMGPSSQSCWHVYFNLCFDRKLQMQLNWSQTLINLDRYFNNFYTRNAGSS